jgi:regulator of protease activity HflC (stomatin/prohibitin superfamily)
MSRNPFYALALGIIGAIFAVTVLLGSWYTVDQGERGVLLRNGALVGVAQPGLGFKVPMIDSVRDFSVQTHVVTYEKLHAYSFDQQPAEIKLSVNYRLRAEKVAEIYETYGTAENVLSRVISPVVNQKSKIVFGHFTAVKAIQDRARLNLEVATAIQEAVDGPVVIESVQIENIDFSKAYEASIEQRMLAEVEVQRIRQNAEREKVSAEITVTQAKAQADSTRAISIANAENTVRQAEANAQATRLQGDASAAALRARGEAVTANAAALATVVVAERWNGQLPTTMVPGAAVPMLNLQR